MQSPKLRIVSLQFRRAYRTAKQVRGSKPLPAQQHPRAKSPRSHSPPFVHPSFPDIQDRVLKSKSKSDDDDEVTVNFFEQDAGPNPKRRRVEPDLDDQEASELMAQIKELEDNIASLNLESQMSEDMEKSYLTEQEQERVRRTIDNELERLQPSVEGMEAQAMRFDTHVEPYQVRANVIIPHQSQLLLNRLNEALDYAYLHHTNEQHRKDVSKWYSHCKHKVRSFLFMISDEGWNLLWKVQSHDVVSNPNRVSHLRLLAEDMLSAGMKLNQEQNLARIEGIYLDGKRDEAINAWESEKKAAKSVVPELMELGIRLFTRDGNLERAEQILQELTDSNITYDPRVILTMVHAYNSLKTASSHLRAWTLYTKLRERLDLDITMQDFDELSLGFLENGRTDLALAIFRDMMSHDPNAKRSARSKYTVTGFDKLVSRLNTAEKVNEASLDALCYLPIRFQNKFFYASWLKKLIGMGEIDSAAKVVELMYERRIPPDAKHVNGLICAWFRQSSRRTREKAESMAWAMIHKRLEFVARRGAVKHEDIRTVPELEQAVSISNAKSKVSSNMERRVPRATIETFSILVQYYTRRAELSQVRKLRDLLSYAEIPMNSYFMNHLLYGTMRTSTPQDVWNKYQVYTQTVNPDMETFDCLWECMKFQVDTSRNLHAMAWGFPVPRELFAVMMKWFNMQNQSGKDTAIQDLDVDTYRDLIRCFCIDRDLEGTFIAMQVMRRTFKVAPDERTGRLLLLQISRLNTPVAHSPFEKKNIITSAEAKKNVANASLALEEVSNSRRAVLDENGTSFDNLSVSQQVEETHRTFLEFVYAVLRKRFGSHDTVVTALSRAANDMCVEMFELDEILAPVRGID